LHVTDILKTDLNENLAMIADSIAYLKSMGKEVFFDAEHFFDGYKNNSRYATRVVKTALAAGADFIVLCDTNGGCLPHEICALVKRISAHVPFEKMAIHVHNDGGLAVANTLAAVQKGVAMVQERSTVTGTMR
jgi:2-isopropylmalate synthase